SDSPVSWISSFSVGSLVPGVQTPERIWLRSWEASSSNFRPLRPLRLHTDSVEDVIVSPPPRVRKTTSPLMFGDSNTARTGSGEPHGSCRSARPCRRHVPSAVRDGSASHARIRVPELLDYYLPPLVL